VKTFISLGTTNSFLFQHNKQQIFNSQSQQGQSSIRSVGGAVNGNKHSTANHSRDGAQLGQWDGLSMANEKQPFCHELYT